MILIAAGASSSDDKVKRCLDNQGMPFGLSQHGAKIAHDATQI